MVQRPSRGAFPGLHVFTGGKVDKTDVELVERISWTGPTKDQACEQLATPRALHYYLAAVRECYEEAGVLIANLAQSGGQASAQAVWDAQQLDHLRTHREQEFGGVCNDLGATLAFGELHYFSHWITPEIAPRRFDTRFFVARMPPQQEATHAPGETVGGEWVAPKLALARGDSGDWALIMPTIISLQSLARYSDTAALFDAVQRFEHLPPYSDELRHEGMQPGSYPSN